MPGTGCVSHLRLLTFPGPGPRPARQGSASFLAVLEAPRVVLPMLEDLAAGVSRNVEVPRPPAVPRPDWVNSGAVCYRRSEEEPDGVFEAVLLNKAELAPPTGAVMRLDERFTARVARSDLTSARVFAKVNIDLSLPDGERVLVEVETDFSETAARAVGRGEPGREEDLRSALGLPRRGLGGNSWQLARSASSPED